jgi:type IV pilus assembly protein PilV
MMTRTPRRWTDPASRDRSAGFTLVEALVALVVLSIGLLGIAALYLDSLRAGRTAIYRTQAVNLASDIADRIRANRDAPVASYNVAFGVPSAVTPSCENTTGCTPEALAATDVARWKEAIGGVDLSGVLVGALPEGDGQIVVTAGTPNLYVITIQWSEPGEDAPVTYTMRLET